jgi:hypothetical protein
LEIEAGLEVRVTPPVPLFGHEAMFTTFCTVFEGRFTIKKNTHVIKICENYY